MGVIEPALGKGPRTKSLAEVRENWVTGAIAVVPAHNF